MQLFSASFLGTGKSYPPSSEAKLPERPVRDAQQSRTCVLEGVSDTVTSASVCLPSPHPEQGAAWSVISEFSDQKEGQVSILCWGPAPAEW